MGIISVSLPSDGTTADAADLNNPINTIVNEFNGNIDNANIKSAAAIATSKIAADGGLTRASLQYGLVRQRQGGNATNWAVSGTTNYDVSSSDAFIQAGVIGTGTGADATVTFPNAYTQKPIVLCSTYGGNAGGDSALSQNAFAEATGAVTTTTVAFRTFNTGGTRSDQSVSWLTVGV